MTERERLAFFEKKSRLYFKAGGVCGGPRCGKALQYNNFQLGHRIPQSMLDKYGPEIIHHEMNMTPVCGLECNKRVDIGTEPESITVLLEHILESLNRSFELEDYKAELLREIRLNEHEQENRNYAGDSSRGPVQDSETERQDGLHSGGDGDIFGRSERELNGLF
jgi:hypothetical protein